MRRVVLLMTSGVLLTMALAAAPAEDSTAGSEPPLIPIEVERTVTFAEVPVPGGVEILEMLPAPDHDHWLLTVVVEGARQLALVGDDLAGFRCLTCDLVDGAHKPTVFPDGQRIFFNAPSDLVASAVPGGGLLTGDAGLPLTGGTGDISYAVLECAPSIYACDEAHVVDVTLPINSLTSVPQGAQNREAELHPSGDWLKWTEVRSLEGPRMTIGRLVRTDGEYVIDNPRVMNPAYDPDGDLEDLEWAGRFSEAGHSWADGGRTLEVRFTTSALNYDIYELDLATGAFSAITTDLDWNEQAYFGPGELLIASSARGLDRMAVFAALERPSFIDMVTFGQVGRVGLWNNRLCMNEKWLMHRDPAQVRGGYSGQPIVTEDNWAIRGVEFLPDGTGAVVNEHLIPNVAEPADPGLRRRMRVLRFPTVEPSEPLPTVDLDTLDLDAWTQPYETFRGGATRQYLQRVVDGPRGGTATLTFLGTFAGGSWTVEYDRWSQDGASFLSGYESIVIPNPVVVATWSANLELTGAQEGFTEGTLHVLPQNRYEGSVVTELNGQRWEGPTTQADCPGILQPSLTILQEGAPLGAGGRVTLRVVADIPGDAWQRPVHGATVRSGNREVITDERGRAHVTLRPGLTTEVHAEAAGFRAATHSMVRPHAGSDSDSLPATGGGAALAGLLLIGMVLASRRTTHEETR